MIKVEFGCHVFCISDEFKFRAQFPTLISKVTSAVLKNDNLVFDMKMVCHAFAAASGQTKAETTEILFEIKGN